MTSRGLLGIATLALLVLYAAVSLWPYQWEAPHLVRNGAAPLPGGGVGFASFGVARAKDGPPPWLEPALSSNRLEIELRVRSLAPEQHGPARILTFSTDPFHGDLMLGQEGADLVLRLRSPWTDPAGVIEEEPVARLPDIFRSADWVDLDVIVAPDRLRLLVGDRLVLERPLPRYPLANWDPAQRLALGNEVTFNRPWLGEIGRAVVRSGGRAVDYADPGRLEFPQIFLMVAKYPKLVPLRHLNVPDAARNIVLYMPLGVMLGLLLGGRAWWRVALGALLGAALVSISMELLQMNLPRRWPSVDDVIFNTLGGGLGMLLALCSQRLLPASAQRRVRALHPAALISRIRR